MKKSKGYLEVSSPWSKTKWFSVAEKKRIWNYFIKHGSNHSPFAHTLPFIINKCEAEGIAYQLQAAPGLGYHIRPISEDESWPKIRRRG